MGRDGTGWDAGACSKSCAPLRPCGLPLPAAMRLLPPAYTPDSLPRCKEYWKGDWGACEASLHSNNKHKAEGRKMREVRKAEVAAEVERSGTFSKGEGQGRGQREHLHQGCWGRGRAGFVDM